MGTDSDQHVGADPACGITLARFAPTPFQVYSTTATGSCTLTVTRAAPNVGDEVEGTFSGIVNVVIGGTATTQPITITNGRFRAKRIVDQNFTPGG